MAQDSRVATLQHGSNFRAYYGTDALWLAHTDAANGDVITLSEGDFTGFQITKALTIRGEGMYKTTIGNSPSFSIPKESTHPLFLEGLGLTNSAGISGNDGSGVAIISKCYTYNSTNTFSITTCKATILESNFYTISGWGAHLKANSNSNITIINSILPGIGYSNNGRFFIQNCVISGTMSTVHSSIENSIIFGVSNLDGTNTTSHCLVKADSSGFSDSWYIATTAPEPDPWGETPEVVLWNDLFTGNYHLTAEASQNYKGTDGTEVGIYGGAYPYDITPDYPLVKNIEVKGIHENGKLSVKINVE